MQLRASLFAAERAAVQTAIVIACFLVCVSAATSQQQQLASPIHFSPRPIAFSLDSNETPRRHAPETMAGGVAVFDYDRDGKPDIFFANGADINTLKKDSPKYWNRLFHNNGDGTFTDVTEKAGLKGTGFDVGPLWSVGAAWVDINNDGLLDLFVVNYVSWDGSKEPDCKFNGTPDYCHPKLYKETASQLFMNNGNGTFTDISEQAGIRAHPGKGMSACIADFDNDGLPDIFVPNDKMFNFLYHNKGHNRFEETGFEMGVALPEHGNLISGMGCDFRDLNNDGYPDIVLSALQSETFPIYQDVNGVQWNDRAQQLHGGLQRQHSRFRQ